MEKKLIILADKYSVGYDEIDNQHKKIVEMIKRHIVFNNLKNNIL